MKYNVQTVKLIDRAVFREASSIAEFAKGGWAMPGKLKRTRTREFREMFIIEPRAFPFPFHFNNN
jgi:hypothetical protein